MKTISANAQTVARQWFVVDAADKVLGRLATEIARRLRGKHKVVYTPHADTGDYIIVLNAEKIRVTGNKAKDKIYHNHSNFIGGMKSVPFETMMEKKPEHVLERAVKGMLPKGPLGRQMFRKLKVYVGPLHPHEAQAPLPLDIQE